MVDLDLEELKGSQIEPTDEILEAEDTIVKEDKVAVKEPTEVKMPPIPPGLLEVDASVLKSIQKMGVKVVHSQLDCTGVLTHNLFKADLPREAGPECRKRATYVPVSTDCALGGRTWCSSGY